MRGSEVNALYWVDVADSSDSYGILVTESRSEANQEGEVDDLAGLCKDDMARALRPLRGITPSGSGRPCGAVVGADRWTVALGTGRVGVGADERQDEGDAWIWSRHPVSWP